MDKEKKKVDNLLTEYHILNRDADEMFLGTDLKGQYLQEKNKFENEFANLNVSIQNARSYNLGLFEEYQTKAEELELLENDIKSKNEVVKMLQDRIYGFKTQDS